MILGLLLFLSAQALFFLPAPHSYIAFGAVWVFGAPFVLRWIKGAR